MARKIILTLEVEIDDLPDEEREDCADIEDISVDELPLLKDYELHELAQPIGGDLSERNEEIWSGTGVFVRITGSKILDVKEVA